MSKTAVVLCSDAGGLAQAAFTLWHVARLVQRTNCDLILASDSALDLPPLLRDLGVQRLRLEPGAVLQEAVAAGRGILPQAAYIRLWLPQVMLDRGYDRYLYLDTDIYPLRGDLARLMRADLGGFPIAAVRDIKQWRQHDRPIFEFEANGHGGLGYFNSGVMLVDPAAWLAQDVTARCLAEAAKAPVMYTHDQGLLNLALRGAWAEMSPRWNWHMTRDHHLLTRAIRPNFLHYAGWEKPWTQSLTRPIHDPRSLRAYRAFFAQHFPDQPVPLAPDAALVLRMVTGAPQALWEGWAIRHHMRRFPHDAHLHFPQAATEASAVD